MKGLPRSLSRGNKQQETMSKERIILKDAVVAVSATAAAVGWGTLVIGGFPEGQISMLGVACKLTFAGSGADTNLVDTWNGDFGIGTTPADDATITAGDVDLIASTALGPAVAEVAPLVDAINGTPAVFDNTAATLEINLNVLIDAADITDDETVNLTVNGIVEVTYFTLLDD